MPGGTRALYRAKEEERDQSYFLFGTTHAQLDLLRFPLGDLGKAQTRELARSFGLAVADKHDSQDICFVPTGRYTDIIERLKPGAAAAGDVVDMDGKVLGRHDGIIHFTIGQRRGLKIAGPAPLYVVALDAANRRVVVGPREALTMRRIALRDVNWIGEGALDRVLDAGRIEVFVKVRSTRPPRAAFLSATRRRLSRSNWSTARTACRPARPACSTTAPRARPACSAAASSAPRRRPHAPHDPENWEPVFGSDHAAKENLHGNLEAGAMGAALDRDTIEKAYDRWAPVYDMVFGARVRAGPQASIAAAEAHVGPGGGRILEVGLGTGISLLSYRPQQPHRRHRHLGGDAAARARLASPSTG